jgi:ABC-type glycerol-3-phosphate transport system substrate-binding protein
MSKRISRRELLRLAGLAGVGVVAAACQPKVVEVTKVVEKAVEKTVVVEKQVTAAVPAEQKAEITWWGYAIGIRYVPGKPWGAAAPEDWDAWQKESFQTLHPNCKVNIELLKHDETYFTKLDAALMAGTPPDIVMGPVSEASKYILRNVCSPLN